VAADESFVAIAEVEQHVDHCEACRRTVAAVMRANRGAHVVHADAAIGSVIDRYVICGIRGSGAMGHVYEANDPELGRVVALKVVRHPDETDDARALREGRALAKLAHPNIVAVHDVGTFAGGVFLAMELVAGSTVREWIADAKPSARRIAAVFADVARGLAAAHAAGLVHRDIKPDNLVLGDDGRVRVIDFGLAVDAGATAGAAGTPRYMAPELALATADARSDQFAFGAALDELAGPAAPRWLRAIAERATASDPDRRFPSMGAVAAALDRGLARRRRFALVGGTLGVAAIAAVTGGILRGGAPPRGECALAADRAHSGWNADARARLARAFAGHASPVPLADVAAVLDAHASSWATAYRATCEADQQHTTISGRQRLICLDGQLRRRDAVLALANARDAQPAGIAAAVFALPAPQDCTDAVVAIVPPDVGATTRSAIDAIRDHVASANALDDIGHGDDALARMRAALADAKRLGIPALEVEVGIALGRLEVSDGLAAPAENTLRGAVDRARAIADRPGQAEATAALAGALILRGKLIDGARELDVAERLAREAGNGPRLQLALLEVRAFLHGSSGDAAKVRADAEQHRALVEKLYGRDDRRMVTSMISLAAASLVQDPAKSRQLIAEARALAIRLVGRTNPLLADIDRAQCITERADPKRARPYCDSARAFFAAGGAAYRVPLAKTLLALSAIDPEHLVELVQAARAGFEPGSIYRAMADSQLAAGYRRQMNHVAAAAAARDAVAGYEAAMDREAPPLVQELRWLGRDLLMLGRGDEASAVLERVADVQSRNGTAVEVRLDVLLQLAGAQFYSRDRKAAALLTIDRALALAATIDGPHGPPVAEALFSSAVLMLEHERLADAAAALDRAQPLAARGTPSLRARLQFARSDLELARDHVAPARRAARLAAAEVAKMTDPFMQFMVRVADCTLLEREHDAARAIAACERAVGIAEASFGRDYLGVIDILVPLGEAQLAHRDVAAATATIDRALEMAGKASDPRRLAVSRLAKIHVLETGGDRTAARALATTALADLAAANTAPITSARIAKWLSSHP